MAEQGLYVGRLFAKYDIEGEEEAYAQVERRLKQARGKMKLDVPVKVTGDADLDRLKARFAGLRAEQAANIRSTDSLGREMRELKAEALRLRPRIEENARGFERYSRFATQAALATNRLDNANRRLDFRSAIIGAGGLTSALRTLQGTIATLVGVYGLRALANSTTDAIKTFYDAETALRLFNRQLEKAGIDAAQGAGGVATLAQELLTTDAVVQGAATQLLRYGANMEQTIGLLRAGAASGLAAGRTTAEGMEAIAQAILSESSAVLTRIGISGNLSTAYQRESKARGVAVDQLTNEQKAAAALNFILEETAGEIESLDILTQGYGGSLSTLAREKTELAQVIGGILEPTQTDLNFAIAGMLNIIADGLMPVLVQEFLPALDSGTGRLRSMSEQFSANTVEGYNFRQELAETLTPLFQMAAAVEIVETMLNLLNVQMQLMGAQGFEFLNKLTDDFNRFTNAVQGFMGMEQTPFELNAGKGAGDVVALMDEQIALTERLQVAYNDFATSGDRTADALFRVKEGVSSTREEQERLVNSFTGGGGSGNDPLGANATTEDIDKVNEAFKNYQKGLRDINAEFAITGDKSKALDDQLKLTQNTFSKLIDLGYNGSQLQAFFEDIQKLSTQQAFSQLAEQGAESLRQAAVLGNTIEAQMKSAQERQSLIAAMLMSIANGTIRATEAQIDYLQGRLEDLTDDIRTFQGNLFAQDYALNLPATGFTDERAPASSEQQVIAQKALNDAVEQYLSLVGKAPTQQEAFLAGLRELREKYPELTREINDLIEKTELYAVATSKASDAVLAQLAANESFLGTDEKRGGDPDKQVAQLEQLREATDQYLSLIGKAPTQAQGLLKSLRDLREEAPHLSEQIGVLITSLENLDTASSKATDAVRNVLSRGGRGTDERDLTLDINRQVEGQEALRQSTERLLSVMGKTDSTKAFRDSLVKLKEQYPQIAAELDKLIIRLDNFAVASSKATNAVLAQLNANKNFMGTDERRGGDPDKEIADRKRLTEAWESYFNAIGKGKTPNEQLIESLEKLKQQAPQLAAEIDPLIDKFERLELASSKGADAVLEQLRKTSGGMTDEGDPTIAINAQIEAAAKAKQVLADLDEQLGRTANKYKEMRDAIEAAKGSMSPEDFKKAMDDITALEAVDTISQVLNGLQQIANIDFSNLQSSISGVTGALGSIASIIPGIGPAIGAIITQAGALVSTVVGFFTSGSKAAAELKKETDALRDSFDLLSVTSFDKLLDFDDAKIAAKQGGLEMAQMIGEGFAQGGADSATFINNMLRDILMQAFILTPEMQDLILRWTSIVNGLMADGLTEDEALLLGEIGDIYAGYFQTEFDRLAGIFPELFQSVTGAQRSEVGKLIDSFEDAMRSGFSAGDVGSAIQAEVERQVLEGVQFSIPMLDAIAKLVGLIKKALADQFISNDEAQAIQAAQNFVTSLGEGMQRELAKVGIGTADKVGGLVVDPIAQSLEQAVRDGLGNGDVATALRESVKQQILAGIALPPGVLAGVANLGRTVSKYLADGFISADEKQTINFLEKHLGTMLDGVQRNLNDLGIGLKESVKEKVTDPLAESFESGIRSGLGSGDVGEGLKESIKQQILAGLVLPPEVLEGIKKMAQLVNKYIKDGFISADEQQTINLLSKHIEGQLKGVQANLQKLGIGIKKEVKQKVANPLKDALMNGVRSGLGAGDVSETLKETIKQQILAGIKLPREVLRAIAKLTKLITKALKDGFVSEAEQSEINVLSAFVDKALDGVQKNLQKLGIGVKKKVATPIKDSLTSAIRSGIGSGDLKKALKDAVREQILAGLKLPPEVRKAISRLARLISKSLRDGFVSQSEKKEMNALNKFIDDSLDDVQKNLRGMGIGIKQKVANPLRESLTSAIRSGLGSGDVKTALRDSVKNEVLAGLVLPPQVRKAIAQLAKAINNAMRDGFISRGEKRQINALENSINDSLKGVQRNLKTLGIGDIGRNIGKEIKDGILGGLEQGLSGDMEGLIKGILSAELVKVVASMPAMKQYATRAGKIMADLAKGGITEAEKRIIDRLAREGSKILDPYKSSYAYLNSKTQPLTGGAFGERQPVQQGPAISLGFGAANASVGMSTQLIDFVGQFNIGAENVRQGGADILAASKELRAIAKSGRFETARAGGR